MEVFDVQLSLGMAIVPGQFIVELYRRMYKVVKDRFRAQKNKSQQRKIKKRITDLFPPRNSENKATDRSNSQSVDDPRSFPRKG
jgi:hypothetical protein